MLPRSHKMRECREQRGWKPMRPPGSRAHGWAPDRIAVRGQAELQASAHDDLLNNAALVLARLAETRLIDNLEI
jgi:pantothenate synthetase